MMRLSIEHLTRYVYNEPVPYALLELRLIPASDRRQTVVRWDLQIEGGLKEAEFDDQHGNRVTLVSLAAGVQAVTVRCDGEVDTTDLAGVMGPHTGYAPLWYFRRTTDLTRPGTHVRQLVRSLPPESEGDIPRLHALMARTSELVRYETGHTHTETSAEDALEAGHGVCQDQGHVFVSAARLMGYPARYASGYLMMNDRTQQDASHAWAEVFVDSLGWVGFDVANGHSPDTRYVRLATGLDYKEAAPVSGMRFGAGEESMVVSVHVEQ